MGCEKQPFTAQSNEPRHQPHSKRKCVYFTRIAMQPRTIACIGAKNRLFTATSVAEETASVDINRQLNPATDIAITHPKKKNRDHCPSHTWQDWQLTSTRHSR